MSPEPPKGIQQRAAAVQAESPDPGRPVIDFAASTDQVDRYQEIIDPAGWVLENYQRNPVFQACHSYCEITDTIGRAEITEVRGNMLFQRVLFATEANPLAAVAYGLYKGKFLSAVSVGFSPLAWQDFSAEEAAANGGCRRRYTKQELMEVSAVSIPANPGALALGLKSGAVQRRDLDHLHDLLTTLRDHRDLSSESPAAGDRSSGDWLRCLETAHRIICG